jgi:hypothetical protein
VPPAIIRAIQKVNILVTNNHSGII